MGRVFVIMGVSGSGKTTVGRALAGRLAVPFYDGDDFHPPENVSKMAAGIPLDDDDRGPWLEQLHDLIAGHLARGETAVVACSALKKAYRDRLRQGNPGVQFVYLRGSFDLIWQRLETRSSHFMKADMLQSQFNILEPPSAHHTLIIDAADDVDAIVDEIAGRLSENNSSPR